MSRPVASIPIAATRCLRCSPRSAMNAVLACCSSHTTLVRRHSPITCTPYATVVWSSTSHSEPICLSRPHDWTAGRRWVPNIVRLSTIFYLYRVRLRARLGQELLAVAGIAIGVALLFASQVANTSLSGSVTRLTNELVGNARLQLAARDPYGFSEQLIGQVERLPGVAVAAPFLERNINVVGPTGAESVDLIGVDRRFIQLNGPLLAHVNSAQLYRQNGVALPAHVAEDIGVKSLQSLTVQIGAKNVQAILALELNRSEEHTSE